MEMENKEESKVCSKCEKEKALLEFNFNKKEKKYTSECESCILERDKEYRRKYNLEHKKERKEYQKQYNKTHRAEKRKIGAKYRKNNAEKEKQRHKKYNDKNKEQQSKKNAERYKNNNGALKRRKWYDKNKKEINLIKKERRKNDNLYKLSISIRNSVKQCFKKQNHRKSCKSVEILGCSFKELKIYIENKFETWMNWENYGVLRKDKKTWQLDHIIPVSSAATIEELIKLNHHTNFQPLESLENNLKSNNIL